MYKALRTRQAGDLVGSQPADEDSVEATGFHVAHRQQPPLSILRNLEKQRVCLQPERDRRPMPEQDVTTGMSPSGVCCSSGSP